tara:strand:+ start:730 stop:1176 length:447 start_codon:yes stop_codon:yes gene_type:complete
MATDVMATSTTNLTLFHQRSNAVSRDQNYPSLLQKLIVQSLIKIEESDVELYCRSEDLATVKKVVGAAVTEYKQIMKTASGIDVEANVTLNESKEKALSASTGGGVTMTAKEGRIVCENTMEARLKLVYEELLPSIRAILFGELATPN